MSVVGSTPMVGKKRSGRRELNDADADLNKLGFSLEAKEASTFTSYDRIKKFNSKKKAELSVTQS